NPWHRNPEADGVLEYCDREGLTLLPWSPLGGSRRFSQIKAIEAIVQLAQAKSVSVYSIVLAWLRAKSSSVIPIPGASKPESIEDSVTAASIDLSNAEVEQIDKATAG
ncbi:MAG: aldo/keto reductase, partial [Verrucomicrobia bacterium]|nr:aldo/keto reductase [Leptolyngbya sp. ES-bin-22]